jgi:SSS family solute:Na+ symporter
LVYTIIGPRVRKLAKDNDYVTIGEMIRARIGVVTERSTALIVIIFALLYSAMQLYVSGNIFATVLDLDAWIGVWGVAVVVGIYLFFGGYSTVVKTDAIQFFLIVSLIMVPFFFVPAKEDILDFGSIFSLPTDLSWALLLVGFCFPLSAADVWQRVFSARNDKVIRYSFPLAGVMLGIMTLSLIFLGMASKPYLGDDITADNAFFLLFEGNYIAPWLLAFIAVVTMAICMSTLDTMSYLAAATIGKNFMPPRVTEKREQYVVMSRIVMIVILIGMAIVAMTISDVIQFLFDTASLLFILGPLYVAVALGLPHVKKRRTDVMMTLATAASALLYLFLFVNGYFDQYILSMIAPVALNAILVSGILLMSKAKHA